MIVHGLTDLATSSPLLWPRTRFWRWVNVKTTKITTATSAILTISDRLVEISSQTGPQRQRDSTISQLTVWLILHVDINVASIGCTVARLVSWWMTGWQGLVSVLLLAALVSIRVPYVYSSAHNCCRSCDNGGTFLTVCSYYPSWSSIWSFVGVSSDDVAVILFCWTMCDCVGVCIGAAVNQWCWWSYVLVRVRHGKAFLLGKGWRVAELVPVPVYNVISQVPGCLNTGVKRL